MACRPLTLFACISLSLALSNNPTTPTKSNTPNTKDVTPAKLLSISSATSPPKKKNAHEKSASSGASFNAQCGVCTPISSLDRDYMLDQRVHLPDNKHASCSSLKPSSYGLQMDRILGEVASPNHDCMRGFRPTAVENGLGASIASLVKPLMHAVKHQECALTPTLTTWSGESCDGYECFFQPLVKGKVNMLNHKQFSDKTAALCEDGFRDPKYCPTWWQYQREQEDPPMNSTEASLSDNCLYSYSFTEQGESILADEFRNRGLFFTVSHIFNHLLRPNEKIQERVKLAKKAMGWPNGGEPILSVHVRNGDACLKEAHNMQGRKCDGLSHYMPAISLMAKKYGFKHIFLATDTEEVRAETKKYTQYNWIFQKESKQSIRRSRVLSHINIEKALQYNLIDPFEEGAAYLLDLYLMAEGHAFVGKFTSNLDRLVVNLMGAKNDCIRPFMSLDSGWCFDYGLASGDGDIGDFQC